MDNTIALAAAAVVLLIIIILVSVLRKQFESKGGNVAEPVQAAAAAAPAPAGGVRRAVAVRNRLRNRLNQQRDPDDGEAIRDDAVAAEGSDEEGPASLVDLSELGKVGKKKLAKLEAKAEKKAAREAEEKEREERKEKELERMKERKKQEEMEEQLEKEKEEQIKREAEEKARKEHEEYLKMKALFSVDEQGFDAEEDKAEENMLQKFVDYVMNAKIVLLEELASNFQLKTQDAIDRLQKLVQEGTLTGVIDDRGKFIYISREEMESVAKFIRQRGRVSLLDLAESSNQLIQLGPQSVPT